MINAIFAVLILIMFPASEAVAACTGTRVKRSNIESTFDDKLICAEKPGAKSNNDRWAEEHIKGGALFERGTGTTLHPRAQVGNWAKGGPNDNNGTIVYKYTKTPGGAVTAGPYEFSVFQDGTTIIFCTPDGTTEKARTTLVVSPIPSAATKNPCGFPSKP